MNRRYTRALKILGCCLAWMVPMLHSQPEVLDKIVAVVGKEYILLSDLKDQTEYYALSNRMDPTTPGLRDQVLDAMINQKLMLARAQEDTNIVVHDEDVTTQLDQVIAQRVKQFGSEKKLEETYNMPIARMKREWRDEMRNQMMIQNIQQEKFGDIQVTRREVEEFYGKYKDSLPPVQEELELYHIFRLPKISAEARATVMEKAQKILDSIKAGGDFADFARRYSEDPGTKAYGGDLGFAHRGQFFKEFEEAVFALKEHQLANIVETPVGLHIMELIERRGEMVHARHILFKIERSAADAESTKQFLRGLKDSVAHGESFMALAKHYSEDKETAPLGGFLGKFAVNEFDKSLLDVVKNMKDGDVSDPAEVDFGTSKGYHIVWLKQRITEHRMTLENDYRRLEQLATNFKRNQEYQDWVKQLRKEIFWEIRS